MLSIRLVQLGSATAALVLCAGAALATGKGKPQGNHKPPAAQSVTGPSGWVNPLKKPYLTEPLSICDEGAFYVGGVPKVSNYLTSAIAEGVPQQVIIGQMYVQFQIPKKRRQWPIIMVHGGGFNGATLEATPQGSEGWLPYSVRNNLATFNIDMAGRGRSGFDDSVLHEARITNNLSLIPTFRGTTNDSRWTFDFGHLIPAGSTILDGLLIQHGDPADPACASDPAHCTYRPKLAFDAIDPKVEARVGAIGPAPNPANNTQLALGIYKWQVPYGDRVLPSSTCATCTNPIVGPSETWSGRALAELVEGLGGAIVVGHSQGVFIIHHMTRFLKENGQLDKLKGLISIEQSCNLQNYGLAADGSDFDKVPYLAVKGDYSGVPPSELGHATCVNTVNMLKARRAAGRGTAKADYMQLDDPSYRGKFNGTTHMMMMGTNALKVFDEINKWASAHIRNPIVTDNCRSSGKDHDDDDDDHHHGRR